MIYEDVPAVQSEVVFQCGRIQNLDKRCGLEIPAGIYRKAVGKRGVRIVADIRQTFLLRLRCLATKSVTNPKRTATITMSMMLL